MVRSKIWSKNCLYKPNQWQWCFIHKRPITGLETIVLNFLQKGQRWSQKKHLEHNVDIRYKSNTYIMSKLASDHECGLWRLWLVEAEHSLQYITMVIKKVVPLLTSCYLLARGQSIREGIQKLFPTKWEKYFLFVWILGHFMVTFPKDVVLPLEKLKSLRNWKLSSCTLLQVGSTPFF